MRRRWLWLVVAAAWLVAGYIAFLSDASAITREGALFLSASVMLIAIYATREGRDV